MYTYVSHTVDSDTPLHKKHQQALDTGPLRLGAYVRHARGARDTHINALSARWLACPQLSCARSSTDKAPSSHHTESCIKRDYHVTRPTYTASVPTASTRPLRWFGRILLYPSGGPRQRETGPDTITPLASCYLPSAPRIPFRQHAVSTPSHGPGPCSLCGEPGCGSCGAALVKIAEWSRGFFTAPAGGRCPSRISRGPGSRRHRPASARPAQAAPRRGSH